MADLPDVRPGDSDYVMTLETHRARMKAATDENARLRRLVSLGARNMRAEAELIRAAGHDGEYHRTLAARLVEIADLLDQNERSTG